MNATRTIGILLGVAILGSPLYAGENNPVFKSVKYGIFIHHAWGGKAYALTKHPDLSVPKSIDEVADSFDIPRFVRDLQAFGAEYISFTAWHAEMNPIFPCAAMDQWRGPEHAARRDVIGELIKELKPTGIKLFLYIHPSDGHDMTKEDQELLGWNESTNIPPARAWAPGKFVKWNNFMNEVFDEMCGRYGKDVSGYWVDGGWERIDKTRLQRTVWKHNPKAEFVSGMDNAGWCHQFNQMIPPDPGHGIPAATPSNADTWPCFSNNVNLLQGGCWWSTGGSAKVSPVDMLRYTVLQAGANTEGGGTGWAADPYTDGTWEPNVKEYFVMLGQLMKPIEESIKNTHPSDSWITPQGARIATLPQGMVATKSADGAYEYVHVLRAPTGQDEKTKERYVGSLQLPPPADFKKFTKAVLLRSGRAARLTQDPKGVRIDVPGDAWDPIDTVIKLTGEAGYGILSKGKTVTMSGPETPGWSLRSAVDGNKDSGWSSEAAKQGESPWVMIDLENVVGISRVHLYPRVLDKTVGHNFPVDFEVAISNDGQTFTKALSLADYQVASVRKEAEDLALSAVGQKSSADYPQYFVMPGGSSGRYLKITGKKLKDENRMQFMEIEVLGSGK
jgi:hypothetical protein